jgi:thioredoxin reductase
LEPRNDAIIIGGGAAGLSAALVLGRARRNVVVLDDARPRNAAAEFSHGFFTRDGARPGEIARLARRDLAAYPSVRIETAAATAATRSGDGFSVTDATGRRYAGKKLLIATGVFDELPRVPGLDERWGKSIFVCPFCDGWEVQDQVLGIYGKGHEAVGLAQELRGWSTQLVVCAETDDLTADDRLWLAATDTRFNVGPLRAITGPGNTLRFEDAEEIVCDALFLTAPLRQHSPLFAALGCAVDADEMIVVDKHFHTTVDGCYAAGDAVTARHQVIIAAASGAAAAITISCNLLEAEAAGLVMKARNPKQF